MNRRFLFCLAILTFLLLAFIGSGDRTQAALHDSISASLNKTNISPGIPSPRSPNVVLYDQYDHMSINATNSQQYEPSLLPYDDYLADDFVIGTGQFWTLQEVDVAGQLIGNGPVDSFNVIIYADAGLPGAALYTANNMAYTIPVAGEYDVSLSPPAVLSPGTYWVMVQANLGWFTGGGQWYWYNRSLQSNHEAAWYNPGDAWGTICNDAWYARWRCRGDLPNPDQVWRLVGSVTGPTSTSTATWTTTPTITRTPTNTRTPTRTQTFVNTFTPTRTATPLSLLIGHMTWQGRGTQPSASQVQPLTLTLSSGATRIDFPGYQATDASGFFTVNVGTVPQGSYNWRVKGPSFLASSGTVSLLGGTTQVEMGVQRSGDLNGDDVCNASDFTLLKNSFGHGGTLQPPRATGSGQGTRNIRLALPEANGPGADKQIPLVPISFVLDDGSMETSFGINTSYHGIPMIAINRFTPDPADFPLVLNQISIQFPDPVMANLDLVGRNIDLLVYEEPSGSGDPSTATKVYQHTVTVQVADGVTFSNYPVNIALGGPGDVYIGFSNTYDHGGTVLYSYPMPIDQNSLQQRSWVAGNVSGADPDYNDLANNLILTLIDNMGFSLAGNWIIRADAEGGPTSTPTSTLAPTYTPTTTATNTPTLTPTPTSQALLVGHVTWQGHGTQPDPMQVQPLTITLKSGTNPIEFPGYQATDASGFFTVNVSSLAQGIYDWRVKGPAYLATSGTTSLSGGTTQVEMGVQKSGDLNGDDVCNASDFTLLKNSFGQGGTP